MLTEAIAVHPSLFAFMGSMLSSGTETEINYRKGHFHSSSGGAGAEASGGVLLAPSGCAAPFTQPS